MLDLPLIDEDRITDALWAGPTGAAINGVCAHAESFYLDARVPSEVVARAGSLLDGLTDVEVAPGVRRDLTVPALVLFLERCTPETFYQLFDRRDLGRLWQHFEGGGQGEAEIRSWLGDTPPARRGGEAYCRRMRNKLLATCAFACNMMRGLEPRYAPGGQVRVCTIFRTGAGHHACEAEACTSRASFTLIALLSQYPQRLLAALTAGGTDPLVEGIPDRDLHDVVITRLQQLVWGAAPRTEALFSLVAEMAPADLGRLLSHLFSVPCPVTWLPTGRKEWARNYVYDALDCFPEVSERLYGRLSEDLQTTAARLKAQRMRELIADAQDRLQNDFMEVFTGPDSTLSEATDVIARQATEEAWNSVMRRRALDDPRTDPRLVSLYWSLARPSCVDLTAEAGPLLLPVDTDPRVRAWNLAVDPVREPFVRGPVLTAYVDYLIEGLGMDEQVIRRSLQAI